MRIDARAHAAGFFLIELLIVISIIAIVSALSIAFRSTFNRLMVRAELTQIHSLCIYAQQCALQSNQEQNLVCDVQQQCMIINNIRHSLCPVVQFGFLASAKGSPATSTEIITKAITFPKNTIRFYKDGTISSGTIYLIDREKTTMYAITSPIGAVSIMRLYRYAQDKWVSYS